MKLWPFALMIVALMCASVIPLSSDAEAAFPSGTAKYGKLGVSGKNYTVDGVAYNNTQLKLVGQVETTAIPFNLIGFLEGGTSYKGKSSHLAGPDTGGNNTLSFATNSSLTFWREYFAISAYYGMNFIRVGPGDSWGSEYMYHYYTEHQAEFYSFLHNMTQAAYENKVWICFVLAGSQAYGDSTYPYSYQYGGTGTVFDKNSTAYANYKEYCLAMIEEFENDTAVGMFDMFNEPDHDNIHQNYWHTHGDDDAFAAWAADIASWACPATDVPVGMGVAYIGAMWSWGSTTFAKANANYAFDVANFHMYGSATDNNNINLITGWCAAQNKPVYISELANNYNYPLHRWAIQENHAFNVTTTGVAVGPMVLTDTPNYPYEGGARFDYGSLAQPELLQTFQGDFYIPQTSSYTGERLQTFSGTYEVAVPKTPGGGDPEPDDWSPNFIIDIEKMMFAVLWLMLLFVPGLILNMFVPRIGLMVGLGLMNTIILLMNPGYLWAALLIYAYIVVIFIKGGME